VKLLKIEIADVLKNTAQFTFLS